MIKSSKKFLCDSELDLSYADLLNFLNSADKTIDFIKTSSIKDFFFNFILSLVNNSNVTLLDSDITQDELENIGIKIFDSQKKESSLKKFSDVEEIINAVKESSSKITILTSGTSGLPKKIEHFLPTLTRFVKEGEKYQNQVWALAYNPSHIAALQVFFQAFFNTCKIVFLFEKSPEEIFTLIDKYSISHISATPTFFRLLLSETTPHLSVQRITLGGEKSGESLYKKLSIPFPNAKINNIYAASEFGSLLVASGEFFKIPQELAQFVKIENSRLYVHKSLMGKSDALVLDNDFYPTGDVVEMCEQNENLFKITGRNSNIVNVGGYNVSLEEVEDEIRRIEEVSDTRVWSRKNSILGNILCADVKLHIGKSIEESEIRKRLTQKLQNFKIPRKINFVEEISSTKTGKIQR